MELVGEEKKIQALFSELRLADEQAAPSFAGVWNRAQLRPRTRVSPLNVSFAAAAFAQVNVTDADSSGIAELVEARAIAGAYVDANSDGIPEKESLFAARVTIVNAIWLPFFSIFVSSFAAQ